MKTHTSNYKENIKLFGRQITSKITFGNTTLGDEELNSITPVFQGSLLKSCMKELDIDSNVNIPVGTILRYQFGVLVGNEYEYIDFGNYVVKSSEKQEDLNSYKIKCYDKLLYSMKNYDDVIPEVTYPITLKNYLSTIATSIGLTLKTGDFANQDKVITQELYRGLGYTVRDVLDEISETTGGVICLTLSDELEVRYPNETNDTIDEEYLKEDNVKFTKRYGPINSIVLSRSAESDNVYLQDEESVIANGLTEIKIIDNQIMNFNNRSEYLQGILDKLDGLTFWINEYDSTGITYYDLLDKYSVKIGDTTYPCLMLYDEIDVSQGLKELVHTDEPKGTKTDYTKADKTDRKINQAYIIVDKQNQTIESVVESVDNIQDSISGDDGVIERIQKVENKQTATDVTIDIISTNIDKTNGNVTSVTTENGFKFNSEGLNISSSEDEFNALHNTKGTYYRDGETILTQFTKDNTIIKDLVLYGKYYYGVEEDLEVANFKKDDAMFIAQKFTDNNNEECFGHFYNGGN